MHRSGDGGDGDIANGASGLADGINQRLGRIFVESKPLDFIGAVENIFPERGA